MPVRVKEIICIVLFILVASFGSTHAADFLVQAADGDTSCTMPSISPTGNPNEYYVTYVKASDYHLSDFCGSGDIFAGTMFIDESTGEANWIVEPSQINGMPARIGPPTNGDYGNPWNRNLIARPTRHGNYIAWREFYDPCIRYYNFAENAVYELPPVVDTTSSTGINPVVSENGVMAFWTRDRSANYAWTLRVCDLCNGTSQEYCEMFKLTDPVLSDPSSFLSRARRADITWIEGTGEVRVAYSRCAADDRLELCWSDSNSDGVGYAVSGWETDPWQIISSIQINEDYIVWQERFFDDGSEGEGELHAAIWNGVEYTHLADIGPTAASRDASLFGSYLVYVTCDKSQLLMVDLREYLSEEPVDPTVLLTAEADHTLDWPAVWVNEVSGEYIVLYENMGSPTDIMGQTGAVIPEPSSMVLLALGGLTALAAVCFRRKESRNSCLNSR